MQRFRRLYMIIAVTAVTLYLCLFVFGLLVGKRLAFPMPASSYAQAGADWVRIPYGASAASGRETADTVSHEAGVAAGGAIATTASADATGTANAAGVVSDDGVQASGTQAEPTGYVLASIRNVPEPKGYILYQHGNGEDLGQIGPRLKALNDLGWSVLAWDYPGYGLSPGVSTEESVSAAMRAVAAYAENTLGWPVGETVIYGRSVGGGPSILLATEGAYRGLITESTFTSAFRVATRIKLLPFDVFDNWSRIDGIDMPVLFLHGTRDFVVPFSHGKKLYATAQEPKYNSWFKGGGHNNLVEDFSEQYTQAVRTFLDNLPERKTDEAVAE